MARANQDRITHQVPNTARFDVLSFPAALACHGGPVCSALHLRELPLEFGDLSLDLAAVNPFGGLINPIVPSTFWVGQSELRVERGNLPHDFAPARRILLPGHSCLSACSRLIRVARVLLDVNVIPDHAGIGKERDMKTQSAGQLETAAGARFSIQATSQQPALRLASKPFHSASFIRSLAIARRIPPHLLEPLPATP